MKLQISVIVPVYNATKTINRCIESIQRQSFKNFELVLINDGSTDDSLTLCLEYANMDSRIKVFNKKNGGPSAARNKGIDMASTNLLVFVDSDDYLEPNFIENLFSDAECADLVIGGINKINKGQNDTAFHFPNTLIEAKEKKIFLENYPLSDYGYPFAKLFKKDILNRHHIRFIEDVHMFEDVLFLFEYLKFCDKIKFNDKSLYNYVIAEGESLSTKVNSFESEYLGFITFYNQITADFKITIPELVNDFPKLGYRLTRLMNRSISTIYIKDYPTEKSILALNNYPKNAWILYDVFNEPSNFIKKWSKLLLVKNMFRSADFLLRISYKLIK
ncbi:glycosyltransferase family 2 protein [Kaistella sp.]|uniref:glycosyltransferase family 2 protein n=1 Tax=Kaistella sp. TaxID=2782235 RepID=UPI002F938568